MVDNVRIDGGGNRRMGRVRMAAQPVGRVLPLMSNAADEVRRFAVTSTGLLAGDSEERKP